MMFIFSTELGLALNELFVKIMTCLKIIVEAGKQCLFICQAMSPKVSLVTLAVTTRRNGGCMVVRSMGGRKYEEEKPCDES